MTDNNGDLFARYAVDSNRITRTNNRVKPKLFQPTPEGKLSVQKINNLSKTKIHGIGKQVAQARGKPDIYGWAKISRCIFERRNLNVCIDDDPIPGHTTISDWPKDVESQRDIQKDLAAASCGVLV